MSLPTELDIMAAIAECHVRAKNAWHKTPPVIRAMYGDSIFDYAFCLWKAEAILNLVLDRMTAIDLWHEYEASLPPRQPQTDD